MIAFGTNFPEGEDDLWKLIAFLKSNEQSVPKRLYETESILLRLMRL